MDIDNETTEDKDIYLTSPVQHRLSFHTFIENKDLYFNFIQKYLNCKDEPHLEDGQKNGYEFYIDDNKYIFKSKKGISNRKNGKGKLIQNFEYTIKKDYNDKDRNDRERFFVLFKPFTKDFYYKDGKPLKLPNGEGVDILIDSTYKSMDEDYELLEKILEHFELSHFLEYENIKSGTVTQCEFYIRIHEDYEQRIGNILKNIDELVSLSFDVYKQVTMHRQSKQYKLYSVRSNRFDELGFFNKDTLWRYGLKLYRLRNDSTLDENDPCKHPKLECYLDPKKKDDYLDLKYPSLDEFAKLKEVLFQIIGNIMIWASMTDKDLIQDSCFDPKDDDKFIVDVKNKPFEKLRNFYKGLAPEIKTEASKLESKRDYLRTLVFNEQMNYKELIEKTGLGYERVRKLTYGLEKIGILKRIKSSCSIVMFKNKKTHKIVQAIVRILDNENKETKHKKKTRIMTRIRKRFIARTVRIEKSEIPIDSKLSKLLYKLGFLKKKDIDHIFLSTYKIQKPKPPPEYYKNMFSDGHLSEGII